MARYHLSPEGPKVCSAKFQCAYADKKTGVEPQHYENKADASKAFEEKMDSNGESLQSQTVENGSPAFAKKLESEEPADIDKELAQLHYKISNVSMKINSLNEAVASNAVDPDDNSPSGDFYRKRYEYLVDRAEREKPALVTELEELTRLQKPFNNEFKRRGGWTRAFLVNNSNGHVHKSMECNQCFDTTEYEWMTDYSNKDESEIVEAAGTRACTVCYPSAPTDGHIKKPTKMLTSSEVEKQSVRDERLRKRQEKEAKAKSIGITAPDGGQLVTNAFWREVIKTEKAAQEKILDVVVKKKTYERSSSDHPNIVEARKNLENDLIVLVEALSRKRGVSKDEVLKDAMRKADAKNKTNTFWKELQE